MDGSLPSVLHKALPLNRSLKQLFRRHFQCNIKAYMRLYVL